MIIEAIIVSTLLSLEPTYNISDFDPVIERKRSNKRRRKISKPIKGLR